MTFGRCCVESILGQRLEISSKRIYNMIKYYVCIFFVIPRKQSRDSIKGHVNQAGKQ